MSNIEDKRWMRENGEMKAWEEDEEWESMELLQ